MQKVSLIPYGIQTDEADYHAHVGWAIGRVFLFETKRGLRALLNAMANGEMLMTVNTQNCGPTALGMRVAPWQIKGCLEFPVDPDLLEKHSPGERRQRIGVDSWISATGAVELVQHMFGVAVDEEVEWPFKGELLRAVLERESQIQGIDLIEFGTGKTIQVKGDYFAGSFYPPTGEFAGVYLQTHERNPNKQHGG